MKHKISNKGFLGPIGDDLPSLIPLLFALIIFFSAFTNSFNTFDKRNSEFNIELEIARISSRMRSDAYVAGYDGFENLCGKIDASDVKYRIGLVEIPLDLSVTVPEIDIQNPDSTFYTDFESNIYECEVDWDNPTAQSKYLTLRMYPVALEQKDERPKAEREINGIVSGFIVRPMLLVVIAWK